MITIRFDKRDEQWVVHLVAFENAVGVECPAPPNIIAADKSLEEAITKALQLGNLTIDAQGLKP